ncbi:hypothetical protein BLNAU_18698 [Blattamonas nauphoetae]|uniref:c-Myc-binding protein n=1 Tax=Blattamonas nauphoetae TaxID=2049346 RepID=A0ABQ9X3J6_9EUKA|nr:hypothetical protein BLNAU_18698 [Blattamonas nauphoetae]
MSFLSNFPGAEEPVTEEKREAFRAYLKEQNLLESIKQAIITILQQPNPPSDALNYLLNAMPSPQEVDIDTLITENEYLKQKITTLEQRVHALQQQLSNSET